MLSEVRKLPEGKYIFGIPLAKKHKNAYTAKKVSIFEVNFDFLNPSVDMIVATYKNDGRGSITTLKTFDWTMGLQNNGSINEKIKKFLAWYQKQQADIESYEKSFIKIEHTIVCPHIVYQKKIGSHKDDTEWMWEKTHGLTGSIGNPNRVEIFLADLSSLRAKCPNKKLADSLSVLIKIGEEA